MIDLSSVACLTRQMPTIFSIFECTCHYSHQLAAQLNRTQVTWYVLNTHVLRKLTGCVSFLLRFSFHGKELN